MTSTLRPAVVAVAFVGLHLPFLPASLEDIDSINFALGIHDFDVTRHQPHPPGYPVFMLAARLMHVAVPFEAHALSLLAILSGGAAVFALVSLFRSLDEPAPSSSLPLLAAAVAVSSPLFWMTAARPLSDLTGLAAAMAAQAMAVRARDVRSFALAGAAAGLAAGIRSQAVWLTAPLLVFALGRHAVRRGDVPAASWIRAAGGAGAGYLAGVLLWAVPLVALSGGPGAYMQALFNQGAEDLTGVVMLWTTPTPRQLARVLQAAFVGPWAFVAIAVPILLLAGVGAARALAGARAALSTLAAAFGPYLLFDLLFQESATTRYALPLVVPVSWAAAHGAWAVRSRAPALALVAMASFNVFSNSVALSGYASLEAPVFRLLDDMAATAASRGPAAPPVLAMHRRGEFELRRPVDWNGGTLPGIGARLAAPPKHEWLEVVKYWNAGGRAPVWFVADPLRSDLALFRRQRPPAQYRWPFNLPYAMGGVRPNEMDWHIVDPPDWYLGEGWAITPETAGVAGEDGRGPSRGGSRGWLQRWTVETAVVVGGRNLSPSPVRLRVAVDEHVVEEAEVAPGSFLRVLALPAEALLGDGDYAALTVTAEPSGADVMVDQFDAQPSGRLVFGYGEGWHRQEYNPATGRLWRWTAERATLGVHAAGRAVLLRLEGEIEEASSSHVTIRAGGRVVSEHDVGRTFSIETTVPAALVTGDTGAITIETSAWYVPAERHLRRSTDLRRLGLKVSSCVLAAAS